MFGGNYFGQPFPGEGYAGSTSSGGATGTATSTLAPLTQAATGTVAPPAYTGTATSTLPAFTQTASGTFTAPGATTGTAASVLAALTQTATGTFAPPPASGTITSVLAAFTQAAAGTVAAPAPDLPAVIPAEATGWWYTPNGQTLLGPFNGIGLSWVSQLNQFGSGSFALSLSDDALVDIVDRALLKVSINSLMVDGFIVAGEECELAVNGTDMARMLVWNAQPSALQMLNDGAILPEFGLTRSSGDDRWFGPMSRTDVGGWFNPTDWAAPSVRIYGGAVAHRQFPVEFAAFDRDAYWMGNVDPNTDAPDDDIVHAIAQFTLTQAMDFVGMAGVDNVGAVWIDGQQVASQYDFGNAFAWRDALQFRVRLNAGTHYVYVRAENQPALPIYAGSPNPCAAIFSLWACDSDGNKTGTDPILRSNNTDWVRWDGTGEPGWHRGQILYRALQEMLTGFPDDCPGVAAWTLTFDEDLDSNGEPWSDPILPLNFPIGSGLADLVLALTDAYLDVWPDVATMQLHAYNRKGSDKRSTQTLEFGDGATGFLKSYKTKRETRYATIAPVHLADGTWTIVEDTTGRTALGRVYTQLSIGSTNSPSAAQQMAVPLLAAIAQPRLSADAEIPPAIETGIPAVYDSVGGIDLGDTVMGHAHRNTGPVPVRITAIGVDASEPVAKITLPGLVEDPT